jgi:hypothetical protein
VRWLVIGIQNAAAVERKRLSAIVLAVPVRRSIQAPRLVLAGLRRRAREIEIAISRNRRIVHSFGDINGIRQALGRGLAGRRAYDAPETACVSVGFAGTDGKRAQRHIHKRAPVGRECGLPVG